jgi:hypothetical protein
MLRLTRRLPYPFEVRLSRLVTNHHFVGILLGEFRTAPNIAPRIFCMSSERCLSRLSELKDLRVHVLIALTEVCPYFVYSFAFAYVRWYVFALPCTCVAPSRHTIDQTYFCRGLCIKKFRYFLCQ